MLFQPSRRLLLDGWQIVKLRGQSYVCDAIFMTRSQRETVKKEQVGRGKFVKLPPSKKKQKNKKKREIETWNTPCTYIPQPRTAEFR